MPADLTNLTKRIDELLNVANQRLTEQIRQTEEEAKKQQARHVLYNRLSEELLKDEMAPRLKKLTEHFPNSSVELINSPGTYGALCRFQHSARFPASVELRLSFSHDDTVESFLCSYDLEILPVFIEFVKHDQYASALDPFDRAALIQWIEDKLILFLDTYLKLEFVDQYQRENIVTDPVTQTRLNRAFAAASSTYNKHAYFFVTDENKQKFDDDPARYVSSRP